jgi:hypothetical protein
MAALSNAKAEPTDPIRGILNDFIWDPLGLPRIEQALGTPADIIHATGLPTIKDMLPTPADLYASIVRDIRGGNGIRMPEMPSLPALPALSSLLPRPGEILPASKIGAEEVKAETGYATLNQNNKYYQRKY